MNGQPPKSQHGSAIVLDDRGILLLGPSGSGKSRLGHLLIERWTAQNRYSRWVADDRFLTRPVGDRLVASAPATIAGAAERRFLGIQSVAWQSRAVIDLAVELVADENLQRLPDAAQIWRAPGGEQVPLMAVPKNALTHAVELVEARLTANLALSPALRR